MSRALVERLMAMANCEANEVANIMNEAAERIANLEQERDALRAEIAALKEALRGLEPVAYLWQHGETGRTRIVTPDTVFTAQSSWFVAGPVFTLPPNLKG